MKIKLIKIFLHRLVIIFTCNCMLSLPIYAQSATVQVASGLLNIFQQTTQQNQANQRKLQLQQKYTASFGKDKYFKDNFIIPSRSSGAPPIIIKGCDTGPSALSTPANACSALGSPGQAQTAADLVPLAVANSSFYDLLSSDSQKDDNPVGIQCLIAAQSKVDEAIQEKINALIKMVNGLKNMSKPFEARLNELRNIMKNNKELLSGTKGGAEENNDSLSRDLRGLFGNTSCPEVMPNNILNNREGGLLAIRGNLDTPIGRDGKSFLTNAENMSLNVQTFSNRIEDQIQKVGARIDKVGVAYFSANPEFSKMVGRGTSFGRLQSIVSEKSDDLRTNYTRIRNQIGIDLDYKLPEIGDKNFSQVMGKILENGAGKFLEKLQINKCLAQNSGKFFFNVEALMNRLTVNVSGTSTSDLKSVYGPRLSAILKDPNMHYDQKIIELQKVEKEINGRLVIEGWSSPGITPGEGYTVSRIYQIHTSGCQALNGIDNTGTAGSSNTLSKSTLITNAVTQLDEIRDLESNYKNELMNQIRDEMINCGGQSGYLAGETCDPNTAFQTNDSKFCIKKATFCSSSVISCYEAVTKEVTKTKARISNAGKAYDQTIASIATAQANLLNKINARFEEEATFFSRYFPGANFAMPEDFQLPNPLSLDSEFGVRLLGGGSLDFMENLDVQIPKVLRAMRNQKIAVNNSLTSYISKQKAAFEKSASDWKALGAQCTAAVGAFNQSVQTASNESKKQFGEVEGAIGKFCRKYTGLVESSPLSACGGDNSAEALYEEAIDITVAMKDGDQFLSSVGQFKNLCAEYNNAMDVGSEEDKADEDKTPFLTACKNENSGFDEAKNYSLNQVTNALPNGLTTAQQNEVKAYMRGDTGRSLASVTEQSGRTRISNDVDRVKTLHDAEDDFEKTKYYKEKIAEALDLNLGSDGRPSSSQKVPTVADEPADTKVARLEAAKSAKLSELTAKYDNVIKSLKGDDDEKNNGCEDLHNASILKLVKNEKNNCATKSNAGNVEECFDDEIKKFDSDDLKEDHQKINRAMRGLAQVTPSNGTYNDRWDQIGKDGPIRCVNATGAPRREGLSQGLYDNARTEDDSEAYFNSVFGQ